MIEKLTPLKKYSDEQAIKENDAALFLGYSRATLARWRLHGQGPNYIKISRTGVRYRIKDLNDWLNGQVVNLKTKKLKKG